MNEERLQLLTNTDYGDYVCMDHVILLRGQHVGHLTLVDFEAQRPFVTRWTCLATLTVFSDFRGRGLAREVVGEVNKRLVDTQRNGVLRNGTPPYCRDLYQKQGWQTVDGVAKKWEFRLKDRLSACALRQMVQEKTDLAFM